MPARVSTAAIALAALLSLAACGENANDNNLTVGSGDGPTEGVGSSSGREPSNDRAPVTEAEVPPAVQ